MTKSERSEIARQLGTEGGKAGAREKGGNGGGYRPGAGRKPSCLCGACQICKQRAKRLAKLAAQQ